MALKGTLKIIGAPSDYNIVECEYKLTQQVGFDGTPSAGVVGGKVIVTIVSPEKSRFLHEWMLHDHMQHDAWIYLDVSYNRFSDNATRRIFVEDAYCIELFEYFNNQNSNMTTMRLTIYATRIQFLDLMSTGVGLDNKARKLID